MLFRTAGTTVVVIGGIVGLVYVSFQARSPGPERPPRSGIVVQTEVTALWIPRALLMSPKARPRNRLPLPGGATN